MLAAKKRKRPKFYLAMTILFMVIAIVGFSTAFFIPISTRSFRAPPVIYIHAILAFGWLAFLILNSEAENRDLQIDRLVWSGNGDRGFLF